MSSKQYVALRDLKFCAEGAATLEKVERWLGEMVAEVQRWREHGAVLTEPVHGGLVRATLTALDAASALALGFRDPEAEAAFWSEFFDLAPDGE